jgi:hypothetical protein
LKTKTKKKKFLVSPKKARMAFCNRVESCEKKSSKTPTRATSQMANGQY